jgi:hydroxymethylpyrimidine/phosphomethylpyrimidine kinase
VLSIAGLDPGGGAGIVADVKTIEAHDCWATAVATTLTVQTVAWVGDLHAVPPRLLASQIDAVFADHPVAAVKIGLLGGAPSIIAVARVLRDRNVPIVLDPVCASTNGRRFLDEPALACLRAELLPSVHVLTPNREEAGLLAGLPPSASAREAADKLRGLGARHVLITGGTSGRGVCEDRLFSADGVHTIEHRAIVTDRLHGTGCLHSSSVAARLARGESVLDAAVGAGCWLEQTIDRAVAFGDGGSPDASWRGHAP